MTKEADSLYDQSPKQPGAPAPPKATPEEVSASGGVIEIPRRQGANSARPSDTVPIRAIAAYVDGMVESAMGHGEGLQEFAYLVGAARGSGLLDAATAKRFDQFVDGMTKAENQRSYYTETIKPALYGLRQVARPKGGK